MYKKFFGDKALGELEKVVDRSDYRGWSVERKQKEFDRVTAASAEWARRELLNTLPELSDEVRAMRVYRGEVLRSFQPQEAQ